MPSWRMKVLLQAVLAHVPLGERVNHALQRVHRNTAGRKQEILDLLPVLTTGLDRIRAHTPIEDAAIVEVGTGWLPLPTTLLYLAGARAITTIDHQRHARF